MTSPSGHPHVDEIIELIGKQSPLQRKRIAAFVEKQPARYWEYAESILAELDGTFLRTPADKLEAAKSYDRMCMDFLREQIRFKKTRVYSVAAAAHAQRDVYDNPEVMRYYMVGLLLSYFFWPNHYAMLDFLRAGLPERQAQRYLEIAPGHGLFTSEALKRWPGLEADLVDISATSLAVTRDLLEAFGAGGRARLVQGDFLATDLPHASYDFIMMGEVLEHVDRAPEMMERARALLVPCGQIFMTTCANCPAIDHVYHFRNVAQIRGLLAAAGLRVVKDIALPADPVPEEDWEDELTTINYAAFLERPRPRAS